MRNILDKVCRGN